MKYAFGGFGCNNVGDEAILQGMRTTWPDLIEIYVNKSYDPTAVWYGDLFSGKVAFNKNADELIIGGGGITHCKSAVEDYIKMARGAKMAGLKVSIQGVGLEGCNTFIDTVKELLALSDYTTVRSFRSQGIAKYLGFTTPLVKDFAYSLTPRKSDHLRNEVAVSSAPEKFEELVEQIRALLEVTDVCFIPHSKAWVSVENNDLVTAHKLFSSLGLWDPGIKHRFSLFADVFSPLKTIYHYSEFKGVLTSRYHGCIFGDIADIPIAIMHPVTNKLMSFAQDYEGDNLTQLNTLEQLKTWAKGL